jgi:hypothetical protein
MTKKKKKLSLLNAIQTFQTFKFSILSISQKNLVVIKQLQLRHLYNLTLGRRLLNLHFKSKKKRKYKFLLKHGNFVRKRKKPFKILLKIYSRNFARFVRKRKKFKKYFKRAFRRHKRTKKWRRRRRGIFGLFRSRYCYKHKFYVPRHFELNYKTGNMLYLGYNDTNSIDFRLPFDLNIRRLVTLLSS